MEDTPEWWQWKPGRTLVGEVVDIGYWWKTRGGHPTLTVRAKDGETWRLACVHKSLRGQLEACAPLPGSRVELTFEGMREGRAGHPYAKWRVLCSRKRGDRGR